jgi:hypothetical protein
MGASFIGYDVGDDEGAALFRSITLRRAKLVENGGSGAAPTPSTAAATAPAAKRPRIAASFGGASTGGGGAAALSVLRPPSRLRVPLSIGTLQHVCPLSGAATMLHYCCYGAHVSHA